LQPFKEVGLGAAVRMEITAPDLNPLVRELENVTGFCPVPSAGGSSSSSSSSSAGQEEEGSAGGR
jgi:hypothetical protein